ncbi:MAG: phosphoglycerate kinase [Alphaproteobacteria bacterium]
MPFKTLSDLGDLAGKRVLVRVDLNVPVKDGAVTDTTRIDRVIPTITELSDGGAKVILLAHFGRPKGAPNPSMSLAPVAPAVANALGRPVAFTTDCIGPVAASAVDAMANGDVLLLENTRFHPGEEGNDQIFIIALAKLGDIYINDAFSAAHRAHASTEGIARLLPAYAGRAMQAELEALNTALGAPKKPLIAIVGGAKVSTKIDLLANLLDRVDALVIGGGMANTFLAARGVNVANSLQEPDLHGTARQIMAKAVEAGTAIILPTDAVVAREYAQNAPSEVVSIDAVPDGTMILDTGPQSVVAINDWIDRAATLVWNGPLGAFETAPFDKATMATARHAAARCKAGDLLAVAGGGDTVAALNQAGIADDFTYVSTAGGAFLEWMEGKALPGVEALNA